jgi:hypothetical protein
MAGRQPEQQQEVDSEHRREDNEAEVKMKVKRSLQLSAIFFLPIGRCGEGCFRGNCMSILHVPRLA